MGGVSGPLSGPDLEQGVAEAEIVQGKPLLGHAKGEPVLLIREGDRLYATGATCSHYGGPLAEGIQVDGTLRCPWHQWEYDIRTGKSWCDPRSVRVRNFPVTIEPGARLVEGPYVAETFPVSIENQYVVVEM